MYQLVKLTGGKLRNPGQHTVIRYNTAKIEIISPIQGVVHGLE